MTSLSRVLIVTGGSISIAQLRTIYEQGHYDLVFGVDHGMDYLLAAELIPDLILGDFDSCDPMILEGYRSDGIEVLEYPSKKNMTDTQLAIVIAIERGAKAVTLMGASGTRMDHTLGNIVSVAAYCDQLRIELIDAHNKMFYVRADCSIKKEAYTYVSLLPLTEVVEGVRFTGVEYPLWDVTLKMNDSLGISNEIIDETGELSLKKGLLLVIQSVD